MSGASEVDVDGGTVAAAVALPAEGVAAAAAAAAESAVPNDVDPLLTSPPTSPPNPPPDDDPNCAEPDMADKSLIRLFGVGKSLEQERKLLERIAYQQGRQPANSCKKS